MKSHHRLFAGCTLAIVGLGCGEVYLSQQTQRATPAEVTRTQEPRPAFSDPRQALEALLVVVARASDTSGTTREMLRNIRADAEWLRDARAGWLPNDYREFTLGIELDTLLLTEFLSTNRSDPEPVRIVARDLNIKRQQCRAHGGPKAVAVAVTTRDSTNREVPGYEVWYVKKGFEKKAQYYRPFPTNSSPARKEFAEAGYYVLWTAQPSGTGPTGPKRDVEIGPDPQLAVDLPTPPGV